MLPATDKFSEDFAGYPITSLIDYYSGSFSVMSLEIGDDNFGLEECNWNAWDYYCGDDV